MKKKIVKLEMSQKQEPQKEFSIESIYLIVIFTRIAGRYAPLFLGSSPIILFQLSIPILPMSIWWLSALCTCVARPKLYLRLYALTFWRSFDLAKKRRFEFKYRVGLID